MFLNTKTAGRTLVQGTGDIYKRCFASCSHSQQCIFVESSGVPRNFFRGGVQQIQLRREDRDDGDLGAVAP